MIDTDELLSKFESEEEELEALIQQTFEQERGIEKARNALDSIEQSIPSEQEA